MNEVFEQTEYMDYNAICFMVQILQLILLFKCLSFVLLGVKKNDFHLDS